MYKNLRISALILAAGMGLRMGEEKGKLRIELEGKSIIQWTLEKFLPSPYIDEFILVIRKEDRSYFEKLLANLHEEYRCEDKKIKLVDGGRTRSESSFNGLKAVDGKSDLVLIHDGARPFVKRNIVDKAIEEMANLKIKVSKIDGLIVCVPTIDTIKRVGKDKLVEETPQRNFLYNVQTPQIFDKNKLKEVYERSFTDGISSTDDSYLMEHYGYKIKVLEGDYSNIKITTREDLIFAKALRELGEI